MVELNTILMLGLPVFLFLIAWGLNQYRKAKASEISVEDDMRISGLAQQAVRAANEYSRAASKDGGEKWLPEQKLKFVKETLKVGFPNVPDVLLDAIIHSAVYAVRLLDENGGLPFGDSDD